MNTFQSLKEMLERLHDNLFKMNSYFTLWESLTKLIAPNIIGLRNAQENLEVMNRFNTLFHFTTGASQSLYLLELAKFFDRDKDALSIYKVLSFAQENISDFGYENYKLYSGQPILNNEDEYEPINLALIEEYQKKLKGKSKDIQRLMNFRNQYIGHNQLSPEKDSAITIGEIQELINLLIEVLNGLTLHLFRSTWWHKHQDDHIYQEIERLLDYLKRFEPYRIDEIKKESEKRMEEYRRKLK